MDLCEKLPSALDQEALLHRYRALKPLSNGNKDLLGGGQVPRHGVPRWEAAGSPATGPTPSYAHPLLPVRDALKKLVVDKMEAEEAEVLLLWGTPFTTGRMFYRALGTVVRYLARWTKLGGDTGTWTGQNVIFVARSWAQANGVTHQKALDTLGGFINEVLLSVRPVMLDRPIDQAAVDLARSLAGKDSHLAFLLALCLMRVAAWELDGLLRWRAIWLQGARTDPDAIPGTSTRGRELTALLRGHVLELVLGYSAGRKTITYKLQAQIA